MNTAMLDQVTSKKLLEEAEEIKRCLPSEKQDVDVIVLCELLMSLPSEIKNRAEHIIGIITGKDPVDSAEFSDEEEQSVNNESRDQTQDDIEEVSKSDVQHFATKNSVITIEVSDTEDDRDYYYDDISILDMNPGTSDTSSSGSDAILDESKTVSRNKSKTSVNVDSGTNEIECLQENNNNVSLKENNNDVIYMKSVFYERNSFSESPKPGCSKDSDDGSRSLKEYCSSCNLDDLQIDANRIHTLLPNFDYTLIYKTLCNNQLANNRVELTLWDLLPKERPSPQLASKRKHKFHKIHPLKIKRHSSYTIQHKNISEENATDTRTALEEEDKVCARNEMEVVDIEPQKNRESVLLTSDEIKMDTTEESHYVIDMNNTDDSVNYSQINMTQKVKVDQLDTPSNDVNMCKNVHLEKLSENGSENKELQPTMNSAMLYKTELNNILSVPTVLPNVVPSITALNIADPSNVASSTASPIITELNTTVSSSVDPSTAGPSIAGPSNAGPSIVDPNIVDLNIAGPSNAGLNIVSPSINHPYTDDSNIFDLYASLDTAGPSLINPYTADPNFIDLYIGGPSLINSYTTNPRPIDLYTASPSIDPHTAGPSIDPHTAGPSIDPHTAGPSIATSSTVDPNTPVLKMQTIDTPRIVSPRLADPSIATSSTVDPNTPVLKMQTIDTPRIVSPRLADPSIATSSTVDPNTPVLKMQTIDTPRIVSPRLADPNIATSSTADPSTAMLKKQIIDAVRNVMPILRPAKFTVTKGIPIAKGTPSLSKQTSPILAPPKLQHLTTLKINHAKNVGTIIKNSAMSNIHLHEGHERLMGARYPSVKPPILHNTTVTSNKIQSDAKPKRVHVHGHKYHKDLASMKPVPSSSRLSNLGVHMSLNSQYMQPFFLEDKSLAPDAGSERLSAGTSNDEQKTNPRRQDDMNTLQVHDTGKEKQDPMASHDRVNGNKKEQKATVKNAGHPEIILNEKASKIYYKLIPMFPAVDTFFIKQMCQNYLTDVKFQSHDEPSLFETLVVYLLEHGQNYPNIKKAILPETNNSNITYDLNDQYADLLMIFPKADPIYLRKIAEENYKDPEKIKEFVQSKIENPDYPTRAEYLAKKKITEQQKQYTSDFKIQQFLELFPDPFAHFENANRRCKFNPYAVDFLKHYFSKIRVNTLLNTYSEHLHNLSLTAKALEVLSPDMKTKRSHNMILTENIPLLQECAFIQHKVELRKYLTELKDQEAKEFEKLKARNELVECQCCYDDECMPLKCFTCENGHLFCNNCIVRSTELILAEGKAHINCLLDCGCEFPLSVLQKVLSPTKFSILLCKRQEAEVMAAGLEGLVSCPFCHFASIPPPEDKVFRCLNPNCMKESCRFCKELNHIPLKCNEVKSDAARLYLEEKMTEALVRKCYKCGRTFFKEEGCNKMTCLCGAQMCYICDQPVTDYKHFQGQGVQNSNLCPLWSDDRRLNAESVIKVCKETMKQIKQKNPEVDINVNALLPKLPPKARGPHEDVAQPNEMPVHAARIARYNP